VLAYLQPRLPGVDVTIAWVGDSLAFLADGTNLSPMASPHTEAPTGQAGLGHGLTRAIGGADATPGIVHRHVTGRARLLLATDGLLAVPESHRSRVMNDFPLATGAVVERLLKSADDFGADDNTTVAVIDIDPQAETSILSHVF
jgi:serine/threonine protein phosphatase PrpC